MLIPSPVLNEPPAGLMTAPPKYSAIISLFPINPPVARITASALMVTFVPSFSRLPNRRLYRRPLRSFTGCIIQYLNTIIFDGFSQSSTLSGTGLRIKWKPPYSSLKSFQNENRLPGIHNRYPTIVPQLLPMILMPV